MFSLAMLGISNDVDLRIIVNIFIGFQCTVSLLPDLFQSSLKCLILFYKTFHFPKSYCCKRLVIVDMNFQYLSLYSVKAE